MQEELSTKNLLLIISFFILAPVTLAISIFTLVSISKHKPETKVLAAETTNTNNLLSSPEVGIRVYASLPGSMPKIQAGLVTKDARAEIVKAYLAKYESPLVPYAEYIVKTADKYGIDFRLITAIAQQESNLCKKIPPGSYNCWGWGIHSRGTLGFISYEEGIDVVSRGLKSDYLNKGFHSIEDIMSKYTPLSNGSWARGVSYFMEEME